MLGVHSSEKTKPLVARPFVRQQRLLTSSEFKGVFDRAEYRVSHKHFLLLARLNTRELSRLGMVVGKKNLSRAVDRNRIKRVARDTFRQSTVVGQGLDVIFLVRRGIGELSSKQQTPTLQEAWQELSDKVSQSEAWSKSKPVMSKPAKFVEEVPC